MVSLKSSLKGSSIVETVIAITIIAMCSLIATLVFANVINSTEPIKKYAFEFELEQIIEKTITNNEHTGYIYKYDDFTIERKVEHNTPLPGVNRISFLVKMGKNVYHYNLLTSHID
tara:strand:+ start:21841 stop:22188 length:348 start_codon:yes stop_codon:yes gene_type:complete